MSCSRVAILAMLALAVLIPRVSVAAEVNLDRTLKKLAASMLRECPELQGEERTSVARQKLVEEFKRFKADSIPSTYLKKIRRGKVDYEAFAWTRIVEKYDRGHFKDPKMLFLHTKAKAEKMRGEEHYVVSQLMLSYYELKLEERTQSSRKLLSQLGKLYTAYLKENGKPPKNLEVLQPDVAHRSGMNPLTGAVADWVYIGQGPAEVRGSNRYRVIAYAPFASGSGLAYRWVAYKGGQLGSWKTASLMAAVERMQRENSLTSQLQVAAVARAEKMKSMAVKNPRKVAKKESRPATKPKLKITIRELW